MSVEGAQTQGSGRHIHKFGGSSLADPACYRRVAAIVEQQPDGNELIVVSAAGKTTNQLIRLLELTPHQEPQFSEALETLKEYQQGLILGLLEGEQQQRLLAELHADLATLQTSATSNDRFIRNGLLAFGEVWSARLLAALLTARGADTAWLDARSFLRAEDGAQIVVNTELSQQLLRPKLAAHAGRIVVTGFIAADLEGRSLLLGRNGSDFSATLLAALADGESTTIWSDVAGVYSADPRRIKDAKLLERLSLAEANELARLGSSVLHSRTLQPVLESRQRLTLRCSYNPDDGCTHILRRAPRADGARIVNAVEQVVLLELHLLQGQSYEPTVTQLETLLQQHQLRPLTLQRQPDRRLLRLAYTQEVAEGVLALLKNEAVSLADVRRLDGYTLVALIGAGVTENAAQCHRFYQLLAEQPLEFVQAAKDGLSLVAILRPVVIEPLLMALHNALFTRPKRVGIQLFGTQAIGSEWLKLFTKERRRLEQELHVEFTLCGLFEGELGCFDEEGLDPQKSLAQLNAQLIDWPQLLEQMQQHSFDTLITLDLTSSETMVNHYAPLFQLGSHLISANKYPCATDSALYHRLQQSCLEHRVSWRSHATVGAGLPVQPAIQMLRQGGEQIYGVSGIFSGTLSWLFQQYDGSRPFSELLEEAWQQGITEPDPREDLSGQDVRRKLVILAREAGFELDCQDIKLESLVPIPLRKVSREEFMNRLNELDESIQEAYESAKRVGKVLRHVARFQRNGKAHVGLEALEPHHPFANLLPCDNIFAIESDNYRSNPLVIKGPGAGRTLSALAVQYDLWQICARVHESR